LAFKDVKIKSVDEKSPYFYPTRTLEIKTTGERIITPTRASTIYEYNQKITVPDIHPIDNPFSLSVRKMNVTSVQNFLEANGSYKRLFENVINEDDMMKYSSFRASIIQPTINSYKMKDKKTKKLKTVTSACDYLFREKALRNKFLRLVIKLQLDAELDVITIPYLKMPWSEYKNMVTDVSKELWKQEKEPMFVFDLNLPERGAFEDMLSFFIESADVKLLAFPHKSYSSAAISYYTLSQYAHKDVAFISFDVLRTFSRTNNISKMHTAPFIGTDVYAINTPRFVPDPDKPKVERTSESIKFFNQPNLLIEPSAKRLTHPSQILKEMDEAGDKPLLRVLEEVIHKSNDQNRLKIVNAISKVHELKVSTKEFGTIQKRIKSDESAEYVKEKIILKNTLGSIKKRS